MDEFFWPLLFLLITGLSGGIAIYKRLGRQLAEARVALQSAQSQLDQNTQDATLHKKTTEKLRRYLQLMDALINTIPNPIYFKDAQGVFQGCNRVYAKHILGLSRADIIGQRAQDLPDQIPPDLAATYQREEIKMIERGKEHNFEAPVLCADGSQRDFLFSIAPVTDHAENHGGSVAILSDLTDKNQSAQDRILKEKLEGVLETTGAVCHEFNQPLQVLSGYSELLAATLDSEDTAAGFLQNMETQIERLKSITDKLGGITRYETTEYAGNTRIIDIHKASEKE